MVPPRDNIKKILESDWARGTPGHTQPKVVGCLRAKKLRYKLILSRDIEHLVDKKIIPHQIKSSSLILPLMFIYIQKMYGIEKLSPEILVIK